jgi:hypothetical protein
MAIFEFTCRCCGDGIEINAPVGQTPEAPQHCGQSAKRRFTPAPALWNCAGSYKNVGQRK